MNELSLTGAIASVGEVSGEGVGLVRCLPHRRRAVVVVRVHVVVVHIHAGQQGAPVKCFIIISPMDFPLLDTGLLHKWGGPSYHAGRVWMG